VQAFDSNVFINCPFDKDYEPVLQSLLFCIVYLGLNPQLASVRMDSGENRLDKIRGLIETSRYSVHDLSRSQAQRKGEHFRLNMPFELGLDYGCRQYGRAPHGGKCILILEEKRYRHQVSISDLAGCDVEAHAGNWQVAVRKVRNWMVTVGAAAAPGSAHILAEYADFRRWHFEKLIANGFSQEDITDYPTVELLTAMKEWRELFSTPASRGAEQSP
jgi:hypothetical protein